MTEIVTGDWRIVRGEGAWYRGELVVSAASWADAMHAIAEAGGELVDPLDVALASYMARAGQANTAVSHIRRKLRDKGIPDPIASRNGPGGGYWWQGSGA